MFKLIWVLMIVMPNGQPVSGKITDETKFHEKVACEEFGRSHVVRMQDWTRGNLNLPWGAPVKSEYHCEAVGQDT